MTTIKFENNKNFTYNNINYSFSILNNETFCLVEYTNAHNSEIADIISAEDFDTFKEIVKTNTNINIIN